MKTLYVPLRSLVISGSLGAALMLAPAAQAQVASALIKEGEALPGTTTEPVVSINSAAANGVGGYAVQVNTGPSTTIAVSHVWGTADGTSPMILRSEMTIGTFMQAAFEGSSIGIANDGAVVYSASGTDSVTGGGDSVWLDGVDVQIEGYEIPTLPGQFSVFASRPKMSSGGVPVWVGGFGPGTATTNRALFYGTDEQVAFMGGDTIVGAGGVQDDAAIDFSYVVSASGPGLGNWILEGDVEGASTTMDNLVVINGAVLILDGVQTRDSFEVPASVGGLAGEQWDSFDFFGINDNGDYLFTGDTTATAAVDEFIVINGVIAHREGDMIDTPIGALPLTGSIASFGAPMNEAGDWTLVWNVNNGGAVESLIINGEVVLMVGDPVDWTGDGVIDEADNNAVLDNITGLGDVLAISPRDESGNVTVWFVADAEVAITRGTEILEALFSITINVGEAPACPGDIADEQGAGSDGMVNVFDLLQLLAQWGTDGSGDIANSKGPGGDGIVNLFDLLQLLANWGSCE